MKTYLKEVPQSALSTCFSKFGEECHYLNKNDLAGCVYTKCKKQPVVFIKADPKQIIEYYEKSVLKINKTLDNVVSRITQWNT